MGTRRGPMAHLLAGAAIVAGAIGIGVVEALRLPKGSVWLVVAITLVVVVARSLRSTRRALVNWAAGITMVWMLLMTLGVPLVDQARSYRTVAADLARAVPPDSGCIARRNMGDAQRALLYYFAKVRTVPPDAPAAEQCGALLLQAAPQRIPHVDPEWAEVCRS